MLSVNELRQGVLFETDGRVYQVTKFTRHKMARAKGVVNVTARDVQGGNIKEFSFRSGDSVPEAEVIHQALHFIYHDVRNQQLVFSDPETNKRILVEQGVVGEDAVKYLKEGVGVSALIDEQTHEVYTIILPKTIEVEVVEAPPNDKGDTASGGTKVVQLETGLSINTPFFIKNGDIVKVNTETGQYVERISN